MRRVVHLDRLQWRLDASSVEVPPNLPGFVDVSGVATRVGVFAYSDPRHPGRPFLELRPPEEVLDPESLSSLRGVPFTLDHPSQDVTSENAQQLTHGWVLDVWTEDVTGGNPLVWVKVRIATEQAKRLIEQGVVELSCGYSAELDETSGTTPLGEVYHAIQRNIRYNHLALVEAARAGPIARLRLDQLQSLYPTCRALRLDSAVIRVLDESDTMKTIKIIRKRDGKEIEVPAWLRASIDTEADRVSKADAEIETEQVMIGGAKLILPKAMVESLMSSLGIGGGEPAAEPPADGGGELEDEGAMGGSPTPPPQDPERFGDADDAELQRKIDAAVDRRLDARMAEQRRVDAQRVEVQRLAAGLLGAEYRFDEATPWQTAMAAIRVMDAEDATVADLAKRADKGDTMAAGRLLERLERAAKAHQDRDEPDLDADPYDLVGPVVRARVDASEGDEGERSAAPAFVQARKDREHRIAQRSMSLINGGQGQA